MLVFGGAAIVLGLATYGYNVRPLSIYPSIILTLILDHACVG